MSRETGPGFSGVLAQPPLETAAAGAILALGLEHWQLRRDGSGVFWAVLDQQASSTNTLNEPVLEELARVVAQAAEQRPRGLVIRSGKRSGFIAGADVGMFGEIASQEEARGLLARGHEVVNALASLPVPTVALIHGHCLGGGLELALACDYRIARSDASLGFPEVQLGLHPGLGGTARLPRLVRPDEALTMMLTGRPVAAERARSLGLVDAVTEERHFAAAVESAVSGTLAHRGGGAGVTAMTLAPARRLVARQARKATARQARPEHYPAPYRLIDLWEQHGGDEADMLAHESGSFADLLTGETSRNLVRVFFLREKLKAAGSSRSPQVDHVHVIGAGIMGGDIAAWCALQGLTVTLEDQQARLIAPAMARALDLFEHRARGGAGDPARRARDAADRLIPDPAGAGRARADLVIEAVPEDLELKRRIFAELEGRVRRDALLATNTSGILLQDIAAALEHPECLVGLHFFNPVSRMQLVEVVHHDGCAPGVRERAAAFAVAIDRLPVAVASAPGFLVNRILTPYLLEAVTLLEEGVTPERVDAAAEWFGMPMGPVTLADQIGLDIAVDVADGLAEALDTPLPAVPDRVRRKVADGHLGVKSGRGLYEYEKGKPKKHSVSGAPDPEHVDRLILPMVNAAVSCLSAGVVAGADELDAAVIFGTGFAPFRGGPLHYATSRGAAAVRQRLVELAARHGPRFEPSEGWREVFPSVAEGS